MKIGDKVRVIGLLDIDQEDTNLRIGDTGKIIRMGDNGIRLTYSIDFGDYMDCDDLSENLEEDGTYIMHEYQVEAIGVNKKQIYNFASSILVVLALAFTFCIAGGLDADTLTIKQAIIYALINFNLFGLSVFLSTKGAIHKED